MPRHIIDIPGDYPVEPVTEALEKKFPKCVDAINLVASQVELRTKGKVVVAWPTATGDTFVRMKWRGKLLDGQESREAEASATVNLIELQPDMSLSRRAELVKRWVDSFMSAFEGCVFP